MSGERLRKIRKERGLTQSELAKGIISVSYISQIENGIKEVPPYLLSELAKRLGVSEDYLLGKDESKAVDELYKTIQDQHDAIFRNKIEQVEENIEAIRAKVYKYSMNDELQIQYTLFEILYHLHKNQIEQVESWLEKLKELHIAKYPFLMYRFLRLYGLFKYKKGQYTQSLEYYKKAFEMERLVTGPSLDHAYLVYNMALSYLQLNNLQSSFYYIQEAIIRFTEIGNWYGICESLILIGAIYYHQSQYSKALEEYKKALKIAEDFSERYLQGKILHNIGLVYEGIGNDDKAYYFWKEALEVKKEVGNPREQLSTLISISEVLLRKEEYEEFSQHIHLINNLLDELSNPQFKGYVFQLLGDYYFKLGDRKNFATNYLDAIEHFLQAKIFLTAAELSFRLAQDTDDFKHYKRAAELYHLHHVQIKNG